MEIVLAALAGASIGWLVFLMAIWLSEQRWMQITWEFIVDSINEALNLIIRVGDSIVITAKRYAKKQKAARRRKIELQQKLEALTDAGFLDRATRG